MRTARIIWNSHKHMVIWYNEREVVDVILVGYDAVWTRK